MSLSVVFFYLKVVTLTIEQDIQYATFKNVWGKSFKNYYRLVAIGSEFVVKALFSF